MSQLDYLWTNFGGIKISSGINNPPDPNSLVTEEVIDEYIKDVTNGTISKLKIIEKDENTLQLIGENGSGGIVSVVDLDKEDCLSGAVIEPSTQEYIDNEICTELDIPHLVLTMKSGKKFYVNLKQFVYIGSETNSIKTVVSGTKIAAHLKIDESVEKPVIDVKITKNGLKIDAILNENDKQLKLVRTSEGLDTSYTWDDGNNILFQCLTYNQYQLLDPITPGKVYFVTDEECIYLNGVRYGDNVSVMETDTIKFINHGNVFSPEVKIDDSDEFNLIKKSNKGLYAKLYWDE